MAHIYNADLSPSKAELISEWLSKASWFPADGADGAPVDPRPVGAFRFDDPQGEVGIETHIMQAGPLTVQVPLTYRGEPLKGADTYLIGTMEHSVLGRRWVYDACGDPVYVAAFAAAVIDGVGQARQYIEEDGVRRELAQSITLEASGMPDGEELVEAPEREPAGWTVTRMQHENWELSLVRILDLGGRAAPPPSLVALWDGQQDPAVLGWAFPLG
ncbi:CG0192-related protein [Arthrobacter caoxuetaonis]|uniref:Maltokinase N-terminal cap domain-containing protein n=1 Tax=Arthrobacter caoxuetaonis TaxID=2886935 RepID=A0A9X1MDR8_9MICC|nr:hypothetical protein [Arthrobacter caoxuetaonis]MCC3297721.1 hypothetical protein [Arthrobacter caoxuetaonis]USQ56077.1 hypothetical protein NF551_09865 [Arthrobacter caoxuetaonis]